MKKAKGISLIELLTALTVLSILTVVTTPSLGILIKKQHSDTIISELRKLISLARQQAVSGNTYTTICPTKNQVLCVDDWNQPLMLFTDKNRNEAVDTTDKLLQLTTLIHSNNGTLELRVAGKKYLQFNARGFSNGKFGNLTFCPMSKQLTLARRLVINRTGRVRQEKDKNGDGIIDTNTPLLCD